MEDDGCEGERVKVIVIMMATAREKVTLARWDEMVHPPDCVKKLK